MTVQPAFDPTRRGMLRSVVGGSMLMPGIHWNCIRVGKSLFLFMRWLALGYRWFLPDLRSLHKLDWQVIRGRFNAHLGRFQQFY